MRYYKTDHGYSATVGTLEYPEITKEEFEAALQEAENRMEMQAIAEQASRPLTLEEVQRLALRKTVNSLDLDDATASRMVGFYPEMSDFASGALIAAKTIINCGGTLKRASVDLWNTDTNSPDNAPTLWEDISYRSGIRIAPETFTSTNAAALDELMWFGDHIYKSLMAGNVYTPEQYAAGWELIR